MRTALLSFFFLILFPISIVHATEPNAGFVQGLWYGEEKMYVDQTVRIYIAIRNYTESDLTGTVDFYDGEDRIERKSITALNGRIIESWADWTPTYGTHRLKATLSRIELSKVGSTTEAVTVTSALAEDTVFVDYDTDNDTIGNKDDTDDDGDGISDTEEQENGTDPLIKEKVTEAETQSDTSESSSENSSQNSSASRDNHADSSDTQPNSNSNGSSNNPRHGLEQYLTPSPADTALGSITNYITNTKTNLDTYRENRSQKIAAEKASSSRIKVNNDGFGEITRISEDDKNKPTLPKIEGDSFFDKLFNVVGKVATKLYTWVLNILSFILAHPMLIQIALLLLILFGMIKLASKFGRRPSFKKAKAK